MFLQILIEIIKSNWSNPNPECWGVKGYKTLNQMCDSFSKITK